MDFINLVADRYSLRNFSNKSVEKEKLDLLLKAAQLAPTAANRQPQQILVIESETALAKLRACISNHFNAPLVLLVCYDKEASWKRNYDGKDTGEIDASIITTHIMFEAADLGLGTTWVGRFDPTLIINAFNIPERLVPVALLPIGYPAEDAVKSPMHEQRLPLEETVFYNDFSKWKARELG